MYVLCNLLCALNRQAEQETDINNVGAISQALFANKNPDYDEIKAAQWQATQVSTVSVMNCLGRILIGKHTPSSRP